MATIDNDEYMPVIDNESGCLELKLWKRGIWFYVEDRQDCCSVGLDESEIDRLIAVLTELKGKLHKAG